MQIEKKLPKKKARRYSKGARLSTLSWEETSCGDCIAGGKAGRSHFIVRVGAIENLYKTKKYFSLPSLPSLDLHGYSKDNAVSKLDESMKLWMDLAMLDEPFVVQVKIICGCGGQVLRETVEKWIKSNRNVSNAPKK